MLHSHARTGYSCTRRTSCQLNRFGKSSWTSTASTFAPRRLRAEMTAVMTGTPGPVIAAKGGCQGCAKANGAPAQAFRIGRPRATAHKCLMYEIGLKANALHRAPFCCVSDQTLSAIPSRVRFFPASSGVIISRILIGLW